MEAIKTYKVILLTVLGLGVVVTGSYFYMKDKPTQKEAVVKVTTAMLEGEVVRMFEGENKISYALDIPETATSTVGMNGALLQVVDGGVPFVSMYFSYEGGRGYMPINYIKSIIVPQVRALTIVGTTTVGSYDWTVAQSDQSEWHVAQVGDGSWLVVVENKRTLHDKAMGVLDTLTTR